MDFKLTKDQIVKLISLYRSHDVLWDINNKGYRRNDLKRQALEAIAAKMCLPANVVKNKIRSLRSTYTAERKKCIDGAAEMYTPALCWFSEMTFLENCILTRKPSTNSNNVRLDNKTKLKPQEKSAFTILNRQQPQIYKKHPVKPADQQICGLSTSRKVTAVFENTKTSDDELSRDPISIAMSPNRDIKSEILLEYEETQPSSNHSICMELYDSNTIGDSAKQVEDDDKVTTEDRSNSPLGTRTHQDYSYNEDYWEEDMKRKSLRLEMEYLELRNYKIKLELYEMEQKLKLNPSKFTADIKYQQLVNNGCD